jgi:hypothetical protein
MCLLCPVLQRLAVAVLARGLCLSVCCVIIPEVGLKAELVCHELLLRLDVDLLRLLFGFLLRNNRGSDRGQQLGLGSRLQMSDAVICLLPER